MKIKKFSRHSSKEAHVIITRISTGRRTNKRVNVFLNDSGRWLAENGFDWTSDILNWELAKECQK